MRFTDNFGAEGPLVNAGEGLECSRLEDLLGSLTRARALCISKPSEAIITGLRLSGSASISSRLQRWAVVFYPEFCTEF